MFGGNPLGSAPFGGVPNTVRSLLIEWANQQDHWVRGLVMEVIATRSDLPEHRIGYFYESLLSEKGLRAGSHPEIPPLSAGIDGERLDNNLILLSLEELQNVNGIAPKQGISFNPCLTLIFGENGCGKTGFVRVLKSLASARTAEHVLPNITDPNLGSEGPTAVVRYQVGKEEKTLTWKNETGEPPLNRIDVFDSRCTEVHVDQDLTYLYTPGELALFPLAQAGIETVRGKLDADIAERTPPGNPFVVRFDRRSSVYPKIELLGAATSIDVLSGLSEITAEETERVKTLKTEIDALRSINPDVQRQIAEGQRQFWRRALETTTTLAEFDLEAYRTARDRLRTSREGQALAGHLAFVESGIPRVLEDDWERFIQTAEVYLASTDRTGNYPALGDPCLYCREPLNEAALKLVRKYREYCNNEWQAVITAANAEVTFLTTAVLALNLTGLQQEIEQRRGEGNGIVEQSTAFRALDAFIGQALELQAALTTNDECVWETLRTDTTDLATSLESQVTRIEVLIVELDARCAGQDAALKEREATLIELESRLLLKDLMPDIEQYVRRVQWVEQAKICSRRFQALLRALTDTAKEASEILLNQDFERRFREECEQLRAPTVKLLFPGRQGQVVRRKFVAVDHALSDILSEGEQKVIALADFLAETELKLPAAAVVFDDPVNSLDYKRLAYVVTRLVQLSRDRQVIVFTHNIWFATELLARFEKCTDRCSYFDIRRDGGQLGIVSKGTHPRADTFKYLRRKIRDIIEAAERTTGETQEALIDSGYENLRSICEVIVETDLLQEVTRRYQPNVMMTKLPSIRFVRLQEAANGILQVFEKACRHIRSHSQPLETLNTRPTLSEFNEDWQTVEAVRDRYLRD